MFEKAPPHSESSSNSSTGTPNLETGDAHVGTGKFLNARPFTALSLAQPTVTSRVGREHTWAGRDPRTGRTLSSGGLHCGNAYF